jgi:glutamyl-tRNA synthetase
MIKEIGEELGFTGNMKEYKKNPDAYKGNVSHIAEIVRIATVGQSNSPDQWAIYHIMGEEMMRNRIESFLAK